MKFATQLFESEHLALTGYDPEKDAAIEAGFTRNLDYAWSMSPEIVPHPLTTFEVKKMREEALKESEEKENCFFYSIRLREGDRLLGTVVFPWISWSNRQAGVRVNFGAEGDEELYFGEVLDLTLRYAFEELGLFHVDIRQGSHDETRVNRLLAAGLAIEVRQRSMFYRHGRLWDLLILGISSEKWLGDHSGE